MAGEYFGKDCPKGKVQVEFVGVSPELRYCDQGWKPSDSAFIELYVDGRRFRIDAGNVPGANGATRRGIRVYAPPDAPVDHSVSVVDILLPESK